MLTSIIMCACVHAVVRRVARRFGLRPVGDKEDWTVYWIDTSVMLERVMDMKRYQVSPSHFPPSRCPSHSLSQKINHFPGMAEICRKDLLGRNLTRMRKHFPKEYNFFPRTWVMPAE